MIARTVTRLVTLGLVLGLVGAAPVTAGAAKPKPKRVGVVAAIGGSKKLTAHGARLSKGAKLTLGERLVMGKGLRATLRLVKPKGVGDKDLVDLRPAKGAHFTVKVSKKGSTITVKISPA